MHKNRFYFMVASPGFKYLINFILVAVLVLGSVKIVVLDFNQGSYNTLVRLFSLEFITFIASSLYISHRLVDKILTSTQLIMMNQIIRNHIKNKDKLTPSVDTTFVMLKEITNNQKMFKYYNYWARNFVLKDDFRFKDNIIRNISKTFGDIFKSDDKEKFLEFAFELDDRTKETIKLPFTLCLSYIIGLFIILYFKGPISIYVSLSCISLIVFDKSFLMLLRDEILNYTNGSFRKDVAEYIEILYPFYNEIYKAVNSAIALDMAKNYDFMLSNRKIKMYIGVNYHHMDDFVSRNDINKIIKNVLNS